MKRILFTILACIIYVYTAGATEVCIKSYSFVGTLRAGAGTPTYKSDTSIKAWKVEFDFDNNSTIDQTITGVAACNGIEGTYGEANTGLFTDASDTGTKCWCKMEPVVDSTFGTTKYTGITSYWVYLKDYGAYTETNENLCANGDADTASCVAECARMFSNDNQVLDGNNGFQQKIFEAIW